MKANWKAISKVADKNFMLAFAYMDFDSKFGKMIVDSLPAFFTNDDDAGAIPLSVIKDHIAEFDGGKPAHSNNLDTIEGAQDCENYFGIPVTHFVHPDEKSWTYEKYRRSPADFPEKAWEEVEQFETFTWREKEWLMLCSCDCAPEIAFTPLPCVDVET